MLYLIIYIIIRHCNKDNTRTSIISTKNKLKQKILIHLFAKINKIK